MSFFTAYIVYKTTALNWLPVGVTGLEIREPAINTVILVSSSFTIYIAEKFLHKKQLWGFRAFWLLTIAMGSYFLYGQAVEWSGLAFGFGDGVFGGSFYLLTGFHGLHVIIGLSLIATVLVRSLKTGHYSNTSHFGIEAASVYWHFVDIVWIVLFLLLYIL